MRTGWLRRLGRRTWQELADGSPVTAGGQAAGSWWRRVAVAGFWIGALVLSLLASTGYAWPRMTIMALWLCLWVPFALVAVSRYVRGRLSARRG